MQYSKLYEYGLNKLNEAAVLDAKIDARLLLEYVCNTGRNTLFAHPELVVTDEQEKEYKEAIEKRANHIPLQHITKTQNFMGIDFVVNENVLIPRQDTEILVEEIMKDLHAGMRILDMCTGSGCILLSLLKYSNACTGVGADLSKKALEVAKENSKLLGFEESATFVHSDLFENVDGKFDIIVSNPPYIRSDVVDTLMPEVKDHEPRMALDGKGDGLYFYRKITMASVDYLIRGGSLCFEIGYDQGEDVKSIMEETGYKEVQVIKDYAGLDRVVVGTYYSD